MAKLKVAVWNLGDFPFGIVPPETKDVLLPNEKKVNAVIAKVKSANPHIAIFTGVHRSHELGEANNTNIWKDAGYHSLIATNRTKDGEIGSNNGTIILSKFFIREAAQIDVRASSDKWAKLLELPDNNTNVRAADTPILAITVRLDGKEDRYVYVYAVTMNGSEAEAADFGKGPNATLVQAERDKSLKYQQAKRTLVAKAILADIRQRKLDPIKDLIVIAGSLMTPFTFLDKAYPEFVEEKTIQTLITYQPDPDKPKLFFHVVDVANSGSSANHSYITMPKGYVERKPPSKESNGDDIDFEHVILSEAMRTPNPSWEVSNSQYEYELYNPKSVYGMGTIVALTKTREAAKAAVLYRRTSYAAGEGHKDTDYDSTTVPGVTMLVTPNRYTLPSETPGTKWEPLYPWYRDGMPMKKGMRFTYQNRVYEVKQNITEDEHVEAKDIINGPKVSVVDITNIKMPTSTNNMVLVTTGVDV